MDKGDKDEKWLITDYAYIFYSEEWNATQVKHPGNMIWMY